MALLASSLTTSEELAAFQAALEAALKQNSLEAGSEGLGIEYSIFVSGVGSSSTFTCLPFNGTETPAPSDEGT